MASFRQSKQIYDSVRKRYVVKAPEEIIRQNLLLYLTQDLRYPLELIAVEKSLSELPHLRENKAVPNRRFDLLCYTRKKDDLYPLLLVECKAEKLRKEMCAQVMGYNCYIGAPFVALVSGEEVIMRWKEEEKERFSSALPTYFELLEACEHVGM